MSNRNGTNLDDWARLHMAWYRDEVLRAAACLEPACISIWPVLIAISKEQSHVETNPTGEASITLGDLAGFCLVSPDATKRALDVLVEGELISYSTGRLGSLVIRVCRWTSWQVPRKSKANRQQRFKASQAGILSELGDAPEAGGRLLGDAAETIEKSKSREDEKEEHTSVPQTRKPRSRSNLKRWAEPDLDGRIDVCFGWYCDLFGKTGSSSLTMTQKRYDAIAWALDKHGSSKVAECLRGFHSDEWRQGDLDRNDIWKLLANDERIEAGISKAVGATNTNAAGIDVSKFVASLGYGSGGDAA